MKKIIESIIIFATNVDKLVPNEETRNVKAFILVWISTTVIMWFYVLFSYLVYDFVSVACIGLICTIIHTLTPVLYRFTRSLTLAGLTISLTAFFFQVTFCLYNGGINSPSAIWLTAHPVIISFFASKRLILFSVILNMVTVVGLTLAGNAGYFPQDYLSSSFTDWMRISTLIFLDIIIATYTIVFINTTKQSETELSSRNQLIENLIRIISHDINNALVVSSLSTHILSDKLKDDEFCSTRLKMIENSNIQMQEISKSILEWMKVNDGGIPLKAEPISFNKVEEHIKNSFNPILEAKSIKLNLDVNIPDGTEIIIDSNAFRNQVLNNVISNAIKFTPQGGSITFGASIENKDIKIQIIDEGIGIPSKILESLFDPTRSTSRRGTGGERGTGFGMPIAKTLLNEMNGSIDVYSQVKTSENEISGTTMTIRVPLA